MEDYTSKYKGEQVEVALMNGDYQDGVLTSYCAIDDVLSRRRRNGLICQNPTPSVRRLRRLRAPRLDRPPAEENGYSPRGGGLHEQV